jgi:molybdopterin-guanine dinucleotide biosynthesis protein A
VSICAVILAGGKSERFGCQKALISINGVPVIKMLENAIRGAGIDEIYISANDSDTFSNFGMPVLCDIHPDCGPMAGIHSILTNTHVDELLITACDTPGLSSTELTMIIDSARANPDVKVIFAESPSGTHPLCAVVRRTILPDILKAIATGRFSVNELFKGSIHERVYFEDDRPFANLNTPDDLKQWEVSQDA